MSAAKTSPPWNPSCKVMRLLLVLHSSYMSVAGFSNDPRLFDVQDSFNVDFPCVDPLSERQVPINPPPES
jgi:hypothetical protein